jgi:hypothetical protein
MFPSPKMRPVLVEILRCLLYAIILVLLAFAFASVVFGQYPQYRQQQFQPQFRQQHRQQAEEPQQQPTGAHPEACWAVLRVPSHGASATIVWTAPGRTLILGCAHAYEGQMAAKPMEFDIPADVQLAPQAVGSQLLAVDHDLDLSLVLLKTGPFPYVAPIAPAGSTPSRDVWSCGYDNMTLHAGRPLCRHATILRDDGRQFWTQEPPWHGRSGGGLIDTGSGCILGCCTGYVRYPQGPGLYSSSSAVHRFLTQKGYVALIGAASPSARLGAGPTFAPQFQSPIFMQPRCGPGG